MTARDKYREIIDTARRLAEDGNEDENAGIIVALLGESVIHNGGIVEEVGLIEEEICVDFVEALHEEVEDALNKWMKEAVKNGL